MRCAWLLLLLLPALLLAEADVIPSPVPDSSSVVIPANLLYQASTNMLTGNYEQAAAQYKTLTEIEPENLELWEGLLWANNAAGHYAQTLKLSHQLLKQNPQHGAFHNYRAFAYLNHKRFPEARQSYKAALNFLPGYPYANSISHEGLAYAYLGMDDYPRYTAEMHNATSISGLAMPEAKLILRSTISYKIPGKAKSAYALAQGIAYRSTAINLAYEDFYLDKLYFRRLLKADLRQQTKPIDVSLNGRYLDGEDERVYPAWQLGAELSPKLYFGAFAAKPRLAASYSKYPRFDVQQLSIKPLLYWRNLSLQYAFHAIFMDNEAVGADSSHVSQQIQVNQHLPYNFNLGLHYGLGNDTWTIDNSGVIIDTFNQNGAYYGVSLAKTLWQRITLYAHYQKWDAENLLYFSLSGVY